MVSAYSIMSNNHKKKTIRRTHIIVRISLIGMGILAWVGPEAGRPIYGIYIILFGLLSLCDKRLRN